ncbi:hypothetical protein KIPB_005535 [Kipferlia bialata]|uniref:Uncharacterized protein n=1 Tax=Kipferlia bialata TaxID=797122 RepID=A0A9K3CX55_9EUKA|nr:hypothetical protein KIPB_005535 [Kipferlia bialata]|eukprot:g5535.t1
MAAEILLTPPPPPPSTTGDTDMGGMGEMDMDMGLGSDSASGPSVSSDRVREAARLLGPFHGVTLDPLRRLTDDPKSAAVIMCHRLTGFSFIRAKMQQLSRQKAIEEQSSEHHAHEALGKLTKVCYIFHKSCLKYAGIAMTSPEPISQAVAALGTACCVALEGNFKEANKVFRSTVLPVVQGDPVLGPAVRLALGHVELADGHPRNAVHEYTEVLATGISYTQSNPTTRQQTEFNIQKMFSSDSNTLPREVLSAPYIPSTVLLSLAAALFDDGCFRQCVMVLRETLRRFPTLLTIHLNILRALSAWIAQLAENFKQVSHIKKGRKDRADPPCRWDVTRKLAKKVFANEENWRESVDVTAFEENLARMRPLLPSVQALADLEALVASEKDLVNTHLQTVACKNHVLDYVPIITRDSPDNMAAATTALATAPSHLRPLSVPANAQYFGITPETEIATLGSSSSYAIKKTRLLALKSLLRSNILTMVFDGVREAQADAVRYRTTLRRLRTQEQTNSTFRGGMSSEQTNSTFRGGMSKEEQQRVASEKALEREAKVAQLRAMQQRHIDNMDRQEDIAARAREAADDKAERIREREREREEDEEYENQQRERALARREAKAKAAAAGEGEGEMDDFEGQRGEMSEISSPSLPEL